MFGLAIARELCREAQTAAGRCLASTSAGRDVRALAALVQVLSRTDKGEHDQALDDWKNLLQESPAGRTPPPMPISRWPSARHCSSA